MTQARVVRIPRQLLAEMWPHCVPHLLRGLTACTNATLEQIGGDVLNGTDDLWGVFVDHELCAAFLTSTFEDEDTGEEFVGVYGLGGAGLSSWKDEVDRTMQGEARRLGLSRVRFCGREAWSRVLPDLRFVGTRDGAAVYERAVQ